MRAIYFYALSANRVALIDIYSKGEKEDLNENDRKKLDRIIQEIKKTFLH